MKGRKGEGRVNRNESILFMYIKAMFLFNSILYSVAEAMFLFPPSIQKSIDDSDNAKSRSKG